MGNKVIVERDVMVPMRDGVKLATDLYRPDDDAPHPVLVHRTPYNKSNAWFIAGLMFNPLAAVEQGYAVLVQDTRGRFNSEGQWVPFVDEGNDGYDTVEWAAVQPWSSGNVGIYGSSYMGVTTLQAAVAAPPHLKAAISYVTGANYHDGWVYSGGAFELSFNLWWTLFLGWNSTSRLPLDRAERGRLAQRLAAAVGDPGGTARTLPLDKLPAFQDEVAPYWEEWLRHPSYDRYWQAIDAVARAEEIRVPMLHISGWYDNFLRGHLDLNQRLQSHPDDGVRRHHRLIIGPWDHEAYLSLRPTMAGQRQFGPAAAGGPALVNRIAFQWFDHWLAGKETPLLAAGRVRYFVMGEDTWRETEAWPPAHRPSAYYLHSGGRANSRRGDGSLTAQPPGGETPDSYAYDPAQPVPTAGGRVLGEIAGPGGVQDQSRVEEREDVLVYTSPRLTAPLTIAGPVTATLYVASSAPDTDFTAKLVDVQPDGYCANIAEGILRARYRKGMDRAEFLEPGQAVDVTIDLLHVAHTFRAGHCIRLEVSSSNFPRFDRNLNSRVSPGIGGAADMQVAIQQVFHDRERPSHVTLPVVGA